MNPLPALRSIAFGLASWARHAPRLVPLMLPGLLIALLVAFGWQQLRVGPIEDLLVEHPDLGGPLGGVVQALLVVIPVTLVWSALSWAWLACDRYMYTNRRWIASPMSGFGPVTFLLGALFGLTFLLWIALIGIGPRISSIDVVPSWPGIEVPAGYLPVALVFLALVTPLLLRLIMVFVASGLADDEAESANGTVMKLTRGKTVAVAVATLPQLALAGGIWLVIGPAWSAADPSALIPAGILALPLGCLLAACQVITVRHFIGLSTQGEDVSEKDFVVPGTKEADVPLAPPPDSPYAKEAPEPAMPARAPVPPEGPPIPPPPSGQSAPGPLPSGDPKTQAPPLPDLSGFLATSAEATGDAAAPPATAVPSPPPAPAPTLPAFDERKGADTAKQTPTPPAPAPPSPAEVAPQAEKAEPITDPSESAGLGGIAALPLPPSLDPQPPKDES